MKGILHRPTTWSIKNDQFESKFESGETMLELFSTKNGYQFTSITCLNREDLINLRNTIDEYLTKTAPIPNHD